MLKTVYYIFLFIIQKLVFFSGLLATVFTEEEILNFKKEFQQFDLDKNGVLDANEVQLVIYNATKTKPSIAEVNYVISQVDRNKDQQLQFPEFLEMVRHVRSVDQEAREQFDFFDKNGDGEIEYKELKNGLKQLNQRLKKSSIKKMISDADVNGDGKVNFEEFKAILLK